MRLAATACILLASVRLAAGAEVSGTDTIPPGLVEAETDATFLRDASGERPVRRLLLTPSLRTGVTRNLDVSVGSDLFVRERGGGQGTSGLGDTSLQVVWRFAEAAGWRPSLALLPFVDIPTASRSKGLGSGRADLGALLAAGADFAGRFHLDINLGLAGVGQPEAPGGLFLQKSAAAALSWALTDRITSYWEIAYASRDDPAGVPSLGTDAGLVLALHRRVRLEVSAGLGLAGAHPDWTLFSGLTFLLGSLPEEAFPPPAHRPPEPIHRPETPTPRHGPR